jgi:hypothetical protein
MEEFIMSKKYTFLHFSLLGLALAYNFAFYKSISWELAILAIIFILLEPNVFMAIKQSKDSYKRVFFSVLLVILVSFNLLAISSSFINKYNKESSAKTLNNEYTKQQEKLRQLKSSLASTEEELKNYPTLAAYTANSPKWENKTVLNQTWQDGKKDITNRLNIAQQEYNKELSTKVNQYNITSNKSGYNAIFTVISNKINIETSNLVLIIYILFAVILEIFVFYTKTLSVKESKNYKKSSEEMTIELVREMNEQWYKNQLQALRNNFDKSLSQDSLEENEQVFIKVYQESKPEKEEVKQIQEAKEDQQEETKEDQEPLFEKKVLNLANLQKVFDYIQENRNENIAPGIKKISDNTEITTGEVGRIRDVLIKFGYLQPDNKQTLIVKENLNLGDFEEE